MGSKLIAVDVGGTFIDVVSVDLSTGEIAIEKQPSTPDRLADELLVAIEGVGALTTDVDRMLHGSTVAINALVQRSGARVGLITTRGFRDVLELARGNRPFIYDWVWVPPAPLVPRARRREVTERLDARGDELVPLDVEQLVREVDALVADGVEALAVCFLHSYANAAHERQAAEVIAQRHPALPVTVSSEIAAEWHEYERTSTAAINAYVQPVFGSYLDRVRDRLRAAGAEHPIGVMQSNGGLMDVGRALELPVRTLSSGPAAGVIGAAALARRLGSSNAICTDVGGTTYDVAIVEEGRVQERSETEVGGLPVLMPTIDVVSIGAGGGSVAWIDELGGLRVGPRSAGARPGPACFGLGGDQPTVTDCHLVLGRLDPERFLGSRMQLDMDAAERAIGTRVAQPLGLVLEQAADGVLAIAENAMANAIHEMTVERGTDPRGSVLVAYGGGGGLFAASVAAGLDIATIIVPRAPGNFSAWGMLGAEHREDASSTRVRPLDVGAMGEIVGELEALRDTVVGRLLGQGFDLERIRLERRADLRFQGQEHTVTVHLDPDWGAGDVPLLADRFVARHRQLYGHGDRAASIELVTTRCRGTVPGDEPRWPEWSVSTEAEPRETRKVYFRGVGDVATPVFDRESLALDQRVEGPALIEEWASTTVVPEGWQAVTERLGSLILTRGPA